MKIFFSIILFCAAISVAAVFSEAATKNKTKPTINPCDGNFELAISVLPVDGVRAGDQSAKIGLNVNVADSTRAQVSRIHTKDKAAITHLQCMEWQQKVWPMMEFILFENKNPSRHEMACSNLGEIKYRLGQQKKSARVCLGDASLDGLTHSFKNFYENTDLLAVGK